MIQQCKISDLARFLLVMNLTLPILYLCLSGFAQSRLIETSELDKLAKYFYLLSSASTTVAVIGRFI